jgi:hypothetical protein
MTETTIAETTPKVDVDFQINKEDLVAIAVSRHEQHLLAEKDRFSKKITKAQKEGKKLAKDLKSKVEQHVESATSERVEALKEALKDFNAHVTVSHAIHDEKIEYSITINSCRNNNYNNNYNQVGLCKTKSFKKPADVVDLEEKIQENTDLAESLSEKSLEVRRELSRLATKERQARALLAQRVLEKTDQGQAFLASLDDGTLKLPVFE